MLIHGKWVNTLINVESKTNTRLTDLIFNANSVIVYRAAPGVKAEFVKWVKRLKPKSKTLAVGDGANDVHMI